MIRAGWLAVFGGGWLFTVAGWLTGNGWLSLAGLLMVNSFAFSLMVFDKRAARRAAVRIPERELWWASALGGAWGAWAGMLLARHKTKHLPFLAGVPILAAVQLLCAWYFTGH